MPAVGKVTQVIGSTFDVEFPEDQLPNIYNAVKIDFTIGGFPPGFTADSFIGALLGSIVISLVSIVLGMLDRGRRIVI